MLGLREDLLFDAKHLLFAVLFYVLFYVMLRQHANMSAVKTWTLCCCMLLAFGCFGLVRKPITALWRQT